MKQKLLFLLIVLLVSGCSGQGFFEPTQTATPSPSLTPTTTPTNIPAPAQTPIPTRDPLLDYLPSLPQIPAGFTWKMVPDLDAIMLMPDGWFFNREYCPMINFYEATFLSLNDIGQACTSRENPLEVGKYSTGQAIIVYENIEDPDEFARYILYVLATSPNFGLLSADTVENTQDFLTKFPPDIYIKDVHQTTKVVESFDYTTDTYVVHHLRVEADYLHETGINKSKIVQYSTISRNNKVYLMIFEAPSSEWDNIMENYSLMLDYFIVLSE
jgi:hypothetical protein